MNCISKIFLGGFYLVLGLGGLSAVHAQEASSTAAATSSTEMADVATSATIIQPEVPRAVLAARRGVALLQLMAQPPRTTKTKPDESKNVTLAIWDTLSDEVTSVSVKKTGLSVSSENVGEDIQIGGGAGYATEYVIVPNTKIVVGVLYPGVETITTKKTTTYRLSDLVYVPYSEPLHTHEVMRWGQKTLDRSIHEAATQAREQKVRSRAFPGSLLADVVDPVAIKSIMAIEHLDHRSVGRGADARLERFFIELALNEDGAFRYERSPAGARGLLQFIPKTYAALVRRWSGLDLQPDFQLGTADLHNAIKAQMAYLDDVWLDLPQQARDGTVSSPEQQRAYLVAAYNAGGVRVRRAIKKWGSAWDQDYRKDWERLDEEQTRLGRAIFRLRHMVLAEKRSGVRKKQQAELDAVRKQHARVTEELEALERSRLKSETLSYLYKYRLIAPRMKGLELIARGE